MSKPSLFFAHITDVHISAQEKSWGGLGDKADTILKETFERLNRLDDLDFVAISGDVLDLAVQEEVDRLKAALAELEKPWHFVPGNHDGFIDPANPESYQPHEALTLFDPRLENPVPHAQKAYWRREIKPGAQLIGLDTRKPDDWGGYVSAEQMAWLEKQLTTHPDDFTIIMLHHPTHALMPDHQEGLWLNFTCDNGAEINALLDQHPHVKLILSGHHHAQRLHTRSKRLHVHTASLSGYPCVYRTIRADPEQGSWRIQVETHPAVSDSLLDAAYKLMYDSNIASYYNPDDPSDWVAFCAGEQHDLSIDTLL